MVSSAMSGVANSSQVRPFTMSLRGKALRIFRCNDAMPWLRVSNMHSRKCCARKRASSPLEGLSGELALFRAQHLRLCMLLTRSQGIASLQRKIRKALPLSDMVNGRTWLEFATPDIAELTIDDESSWALSVNIRRQPNNDDNKPRYTLRAMWRRASFDDAHGNETDLRRHFEAVLPGLKHFSSATERRMVIAQSLDADAVLQRAVKLAQQLSA